MSGKEALMLAVLRAGLQNETLAEETIALLNEESMIAMLSLSSRHSVTTLLSHVLLNNHLLQDGELKALYEDNLMSSVFQYHQQDMELKRVCRLFEEKGIHHIPLKGAVLRELYPEPWLRTSCDVDILIKPERLQEACDLLLGCGYTMDKYYSHDVSFFSEGKVRVELHYDLIEDEHKIGSVSTVLKNVWDFAQPVEGYTYLYRLENEMFYFYHVAHMAKHFIHGGCGVRPFLDLWILNNHCTYDKEKRTTLFRQGEIETFALQAETLAERWMQNQPLTGITEKMHRFIFRGGVYGSVDNLMALEQVQKGGRTKSLLSKIFLDYNTIKYYYPVLREHKWLLPFFEVYRWVRLFLKKDDRKRSVEFIAKNHHLSDELTKKTKALLNELGLASEKRGINNGNKD